MDKVKVVLIAAGAMAVLGFIPGSEVFYAKHSGRDRNAIFLVFEMIVIVGGIIKQTGFFEFLGIWEVKMSRGRPLPADGHAHDDHRDRITVPRHCYGGGPPD